MIFKWLVCGALSFGGVLAVAVLAGCNSRKTEILWQTQCDGQTLALRKNTKSGFDTITYTAQILFGDKAPLALDNQTLSDFPPYEQSVYGQSPFHILHDKPQKYQWQEQTLIQRRVALHVSPQEYSQSEFEALSRCLKTHGTALQQALAKDANLPRQQIAAVIYGNKTDFIERFVKNKDDVYEIRFDGMVVRVQHHAHGIKGMESQSVTELSSVGPNRVITINDPQHVSIAELKSYKNAKGQALTEKFHVVEK